MPQGQFSFVIFDSKKRRVFAARAASGTEPLWVDFDEDGSVFSFTNNQDSVLGEGSNNWQEVGKISVLSAPHLHASGSRQGKEIDLAEVPVPFSLSQVAHRLNSWKISDATTHQTASSLHSPFELAYMKSYKPGK